MLDMPRRSDGLPLALSSDLHSAGYSRREIVTSLRLGDIERLSRGAFSTPVLGENEHQIVFNRYRRRVLARALGLSDKAVSHVSGAAVYKLPLDEALLADVHVTRAGRGGSRRSDGLVVHAAKLEDDEVLELEGCRVTSPARTLVDVARTVPCRQAVAIADAALQRELVSPAELVTALRSARYRRGVPAAKRAMRLVDGRSESVGESYLRVILHDVGVGVELQINVYAAEGTFLARCDAGLPEIGLLIEFDGLVKYQRMLRPGDSAADVVFREKQREDALREAGFVIIRVVWSDLFEPELLRTRVLQGIRLARRNAAAGNLTGRCVVTPACSLPM